MKDLNQIIEEGRSASVFSNWAAPLFKEIEDGLMGSLKASFRSGEYTELTLACHVAQLCAIDDIKNRLQGKVRAADSATEEIQQMAEDQEELDYERN